MLIGSGMNWRYVGGYLDSTFTTRTAVPFVLSDRTAAMEAEMQKWCDSGLWPELVMVTSSYLAKGPPPQME